MGSTIKVVQMRRLKKSDLGPLRRTYRGRPLRWRDLFLLFLPGTFSVVFPLAYGVNIFNQNYEQYGPIAAESWSRPWFILAIISLFCLLLLALLRLFQAHIYVATHKFGLDVKLSPMRRYIFSWSEISEVTTISKRRTFFGRVIQNKFSIILQSTNRKPIHLNHNIQNIIGLARVIKKNSFRRLLPSLQRDFDNGRRLDFGPLSIDKEWISTYNKMISWRDISEVYVKSGCMIIETKDERDLNIKTSQIPNIELLFILVTRTLGA